MRPAAADVRDALARKGPLSVALYAKARARARPLPGFVGDDAQAPSCPSQAHSFYFYESGVCETSARPPCLDIAFLGTG